MLPARIDAKNKFSALPFDTISGISSQHYNVFDVLRSVATKIGFIPSPSYSKLNLLRSRSIGLMIPNLTNAFYTDILRGIESVAIKSGFSLFVCPSYRTPEKQTRLLDDLLERKTGGLIVLSTPIFMGKDFKKVCASMRVLSIQSDIKSVDNISVTDKQGMFEATEHLLELGHTYIAFLSYDNNISAVNNRLDGFKAALRKNNVPVNENIISREHISSSGYITAKALLCSKKPPTAIQCTNDHLAIGVYMAASELGLKIPQDLSVSGFDNTMMSRLMTPNLTTVTQPATEMGETAAALIIKRIIGDDRTEPRSIVLPTKHIIRDSTAKACR